jgi:hypothetical protein
MMAPRHEAEGVQRNEWLGEFRMYRRDRESDVGSSPFRIIAEDDSGQGDLLRLSDIGDRNRVEIAAHESMNSPSLSDVRIIPSPNVNGYEASGQSMPLEDALDSRA